MLNNSSIDKNEVEKFNRLSNQWWKSSGEFKILHAINPLRLKFITDTIYQHFNINHNEHPTSSLEIIDIGCGGGLITTNLYKQGWNINGIDASTNNIEQANLYAASQHLSINFRNLEAQNLVDKKEKYDVILCLEVIEHVVNVKFFLEALANLLKEDGIIILSTINRTPKAFLLAIVAAEYLLGWVSKGTHSYYKFIKPSEIKNYISNKNLYIKALQGVTYNLAYQSWQLDTDIDINYFACITNNK